MHRAVYVAYGSINPQLAECTNFGAADAEVLKVIHPKLFENDVSSARPAGSMKVLNVIWWKHHKGKIGQYSSANVHDSLTVKADGSHLIDTRDGLDPEVISGF